MTNLTKLSLISLTAILVASCNTQTKVPDYPLILPPTLAEENPDALKRIVPKKHSKKKNAVQKNYKVKKDGGSPKDEI